MNDEDVSIDDAVYRIAAESQRGDAFLRYTVQPGNHHVFAIHDHRVFAALVWFQVSLYILVLRVTLPLVRAVERTVREVMLTPMENAVHLCERLRAAAEGERGFALRHHLGQEIDDVLGGLSEREVTLLLQNFPDLFETDEA